MERRWWSVVVFVLSISSLALAGYSLRAHSGSRVTAKASGRTTDATIPQPDGWVPFSADVTITRPNTTQVVSGRYYRDRHGCARLETGPGGVTAVIYIHNIPRVEYYWWNIESGEWTVGPMKLPSDGWRPIQRRAATVGLHRYPLFVEVRRGKQYNLRAESGLTAYQYVNPTATLSLQVPEMNFFDVLKQSVEGRREAYSNVEFLELSEELFRPPEGVNVLTTTKIGGIVSESPTSVQEHLEHGVQRKNESQ
jgi:hypothetical protein